MIFHTKGLDARSCGSSTTHVRWRDGNNAYTYVPQSLFASAVNASCFFVNSIGLQPRTSSNKTIRVVLLPGSSTAHGRNNRAAAVRHQPSNLKAPYFFVKLTMLFADPITTWQNQYALEDSQDADVTTIKML